MLRMIRCAAIATLFAPAMGAAQNLKEAEAAYSKGNQVLAFRLFEQLAESGNAEAQWQVGRFYHNGSVVLKDDAEAGLWFRLSASQGNTNAQEALGELYEMGEGVPQDRVAAYMWYNIANAVGMSSVVEGQKTITYAQAGGDGGVRDRIAKQMTRSEIDEAQRRSKACMESDYQDCD